VQLVASPGRRESRPTEEEYQEYVSTASTPPEKEHGAETEKRRLFRDYVVDWRDGDAANP